MLLLCIFLVNVFCVMDVDIFVHSHCDPGWLETTDWYFDAFVKDIIDRNIDYLSKHPQTKYNFVESIFMSMWWEQADDSRKNQLLHLIHETNQWSQQMGGWVMSDQACSTYSGSIDQLSHGHIWLANHLGIIPKEGWSLDQYGVSPTQAYLFSLAGFQFTAQFRIPYQKVIEYERSKGLDFWWSDENDNTKPLFAHTLNLGYSGPPGFNFWLGDTINNPPITVSNIRERSSVLVGILDQQANYSISKNTLLMMWGGDYAITHPDWQYGNTSLLIDYINADPEFGKKYHLQYSSASEYFEAVSNEIGSEIPVRKGEDFLLYNSNEVAYWTGSFVSQPRIKIKSREGEYQARISELIFSSAYLEDQKYGFSFFTSERLESMFLHLYALRGKNAQILHHAAITGTAKWHVIDNYISELDQALGVVQETTRSLLSFLACPTWTSYNWGMSIFVDSLVDWQVKYGDSVGFFVYNSLGWPVSEVLSFEFGTPYVEGTYDVLITDRSGTKYPSSIIGYDSEKQAATVSFQTGEIPPVGFSYFVLSISKTPEKKNTNNNMNNLTMISNGVYELYFDPNTKKMSRIVTPEVSMSITMDFEYYKSYTGGDPNKGDYNSGAYIFRPESDKTIKITDSPSLDITENAAFIEARQRFSDYLDIGVRLYKNGLSFNSTENGDFFEIYYYKVGVIPPDHEIVVTFQTEIENAQEVFHDELALDMKKKTFQKKLIPGITAAANLYPMQYSARIQDEKSALTIVSTKSGSVGSMAPGKIEVMIHRSCSSFFSTGFNQPLLDKYVITEEDNFRMRVSLDNLLYGTNHSSTFRTKHSYRLNYPLEVYPLHPNYWNPSEKKGYPVDFRDSYSMFKKPDGLEENVVHLLSMNKIGVGEDAGFVMRVNNLIQEKKANVLVDDLVGKFSVKNIKEMKLTLLEEKDGNGFRDAEMIELRPMEIRTFQVDV